MGITTVPKTRRLHDGSGNPLASYAGENNAFSLNVHDADTHNVLVNRHFINFDSVTENPTAAIVSGDTVVLVASTTGFVAGVTMIVIKDAGGDVREHHFEVTAISVNTSITLNRPVDNAYTTSATLEAVATNMAVVGSLAAPVVYEVKPPSDEVWHLTRILMSITDQTAMDDALFGGIGALTNGVTIIESRVSESTFSNWRSNSSFKEDMYDVSYSTKAPSGYFGLTCRWTFKNAGVAVRLVGSRGDSLKILIQDDLTGLDTFRVKAQGHIE